LRSWPRPAGILVAGTVPSVIPSITLPVIDGMVRFDTSVPCGSFR
jgi:hypothetical protein